MSDLKIKLFSILNSIGPSMSAQQSEDISEAFNELDRLRAEVASLKKERNALNDENSDAYISLAIEGVRPNSLRDGIDTLPQQVKSEDARMLEFVYSENYTSSNALVEIELRMLNGDFPTMEEVRKAIRAAISAQCSLTQTEEKD